MDESNDQLLSYKVTLTQRHMQVATNIWTWTKLAKMICMLAYYFTLGRGKKKQKKNHDTKKCKSKYLHKKYVQKKWTILPKNLGTKRWLDLKNFPAKTNEFNNRVIVQ